MAKRSDHRALHHRRWGLATPAQRNQAPARSNGNMKRDTSMIVRIVWGQLKPGCWPEFKAAYKKACELSAGTPGLKARWMSHEIGPDDAIYSITLWESEEALMTYATSTLVKDRLFPMIDDYFNGTYSMDVAAVEFLDHYARAEPSHETESAI